MHGLIFGFVILMFGNFSTRWNFMLPNPRFAFSAARYTSSFRGLGDLRLVCSCHHYGFFRRYVIRPEHLSIEVSDNRPDDAIVLVLIAAIIVTGFTIEALRIRVTRPSWEVWSFGGWCLSYAFEGITPADAKMLHKLSWWIHAFLTMGFIAYLPYSRLLHIITSPANQFFASLKPAGSLEPIRDKRQSSSGQTGRSDPNRSSIPRPARVADGVRKDRPIFGQPLRPKIHPGLKTYWQRPKGSGRAEAIAAGGVQARRPPDPRTIRRCPRGD